MLMDVYNYKQVTRDFSWDQLFASINANFSGLNKLLNVTNGYVTNIEHFDMVGDGQTVFKLTTSYVAGSGALSIYRNGLRIWQGIDYNEVSNNSFELLEPCEQGEHVTAVVNAIGGIETNVKASVECITAMEGQETFYLSNLYSPNTNSLIVFKNNELLSSITDFEETSANSFRLRVACTQKDVLVVLSNVYMSVDSGMSTVKTMKGATELDDGTSGVVPKPVSGNNQRFLRVDGVWMSPPVLEGATEFKAGVKGLVPQPLPENINHVLLGSGSWGIPQFLQRRGKSTPYVMGRDNAMVKVTSYEGYTPMLSQKTFSGSWEIGSEYDYLVFNYISDSNYNSKTNSIDYQLLIDPLGNQIVANISSSDVSKRLIEPRTISISGDASGSATFDGSKDIDIELNINKLSSSKKIELIGDVTGLVNFDGITDAVISTNMVNASESQAGKLRLYNEFGDNIDGTMTQRAITELFSAVYRFKGSVRTYHDLPSINFVNAGDIYQIEIENIENKINAGDNVCWTGTGWVKLANTVDLSGYLKLTDSYVKSINVNDKKLTISSSDKEELSINLANDYVLPLATSNNVGGIKVGEGLKINERGTLSVNIDVAHYEEFEDSNKNIERTGLMSWQDKRLLKQLEYRINSAASVKYITNLNGVQFGDFITVDEDGVVNLTKSDIVGALSYTPIDEGNVTRLSDNDIEDLLSGKNLYTDTNILSAGKSVLSAVKLYNDFGTNIDGTMTQAAITSKLSNVFSYKGTISRYRDLPKNGNHIGDVYHFNVDDKVYNIRAGTNVAWNGYSWDVLAGLVDLSAYVKTTDSFVRNVEFENNKITIIPSIGNAFEINLDIQVGSSESAGLSKLYSNTGDNIDGSLTQKALSRLYQLVNKRMSAIARHALGKDLKVLTNDFYKISDVYPSTYSALIVIPDILDISELSTVNSMFKNCKKLADVSQLDTSNVSDFIEFFSGCSNLPFRFPWCIDLASLTDYRNLLDMFAGTSVTSVSFRNVSTSIKNRINSTLLKSDESITNIEYLA